MLRKLRNTSASEWPASNLTISAPACNLPHFRAGNHNSPCTESDGSSYIELRRIGAFGSKSNGGQIYAASILAFLGDLGGLVDDTSRPAYRPCRRERNLRLPNHTGCQPQSCAN